jgi:hypothetical protein
MPLMNHLTGQDSQQLTRHIHPNPLLLGGQKVRDPPQMADREAESLRQVPIRGGTQNLIELSTRDIGLTELYYTDDAVLSFVFRPIRGQLGR